LIRIDPMAGTTRTCPSRQSVLGALILTQLLEPRKHPSQKFFGMVYDYDEPMSAKMQSDLALPR
jgi:hypothetical protein